MQRSSADHSRLIAPAGRGVGLIAGASLAVVSSLIVVVGLQVVRTYDLLGLTVFTGAVFLFVLMAIVSVQCIEIAVLVWVVSVSGFRNYLIFDLPGLPDLTPDRILLIWIVCAAALRVLVRPRAALPPYLPDVLVVAHTVYLLGHCLATNPEAFNMWTRSYLMPAAGYFFGKYLFADLRWFQRLIYLLVTINLYLGLTAIAEHLGLDALVWPREIVTTEHSFVKRSVGIFIQPGVLGIFLGLVLPFQFYLHVSLRSAFWRWFHLAGIGVCLAGLLFTYTRGGWVAAGLGFAMMGVLGRRVYLGRFLTYGVVVALVMGTGLLSLKQDTFLQERLETESTIQGRINVAATLFKMWRAHPIEGIGFKRFNDLAGDYRETLEVPVYGLIKANIDPNSSPHDIYISVLAEEGLAGGLLQAGIYFAFLHTFLTTYRARRRAGGDTISLYLLPPLGAALVVYMVGGGTFDYRFFESLNSHFYLYGGILVGWAGRGLASVRTVSVAGGKV